MDPSTSTSAYGAVAAQAQQYRTRASASTCAECSPTRHAPTHTGNAAPAVCQCQDSPSTSNGVMATTHSSPRSAPISLPSPPDSPPLDPYSDADLDSLSSFPSVSSSIFFSSGIGSSPHLGHHQHHSHPHSGQLHAYRDPQYYDHGGLIIPSLALPAALPQPTAYGQALGDASFLLLGPSGADTGSLAEYLADADDVVDVAAWEVVPDSGTRVLRASTDWVEEHDAHGLERFEGTSNVSFVELESFDAAENPQNVVANVLRHVHDVFNDVRSQLENSPSSPLLHSLLASSHSTLFTALIYAVSTPLTPQDLSIISALSSTIPVIPFSSSGSIALTLTQQRELQGKLSSFRPTSHMALRHSIYRAPQTLAMLRMEATDRFMRWREVVRAMSTSTAAGRGGTALSIQPSLGLGGAAEKGWSKKAWEASLSEDFARVRRRRSQATVPTSSVSSKDEDGCEAQESRVVDFAPCFAPTLDPLHLNLRSLMINMLSAAFFLPQTRARRRPMPLSPMVEVDPAKSTTTIRPFTSRSSRDATAPARSKSGWRALRWGLALVGVFCAGVGIGLALSGSA